MCEQKVNSENTEVDKSTVVCYHAKVITDNYGLHKGESRCAYLKTKSKS